jgi:alcohol dehydrogenase
VLREIGLPAPYRQSKPLVIEEVELAPPGRDEVLVRIRAAGLCHSDLSVINGDRPRPMPMAIGHEAAGEVMELGEGVTDLAIGDHVALVFVPSCGHCLPCSEGRPALCEPGAAANGAGTLLSGARRLSQADGVPINHHLGCSAFAEHAVVSRRSLVKLDPALPVRRGRALRLRGADRRRRGRQHAPGARGSERRGHRLGGVGLAAVIGAVAAGAREVIAIDLSSSKRETALSLGATQAFDGAAADLVDRIRAATQGGLDHVFEFAGSVRAFETAYRITRRGGTTVTAGPAAAERDVRAAGGQPRLPKSAPSRAATSAPACPTRDLPRYVSLYRSGRLPVNRLMSGRLTLDQINEGFDLLHEGKAIRQVVVFP